MSLSRPIKAALETAKSSDHTGAGASFAVLGSSLANAASAMVITSTFDTSVWLSTDDTNEQLLIPSGASLVIDVGGNKQQISSLAFAIGTQFYLKQGPDGAPSSGDIALTPIFAER